MFNFRKSLLRSDKEGDEKGKLPFKVGGVLAVYGNPSSGKTTLAAKLAQYTAGKGLDTLLVLADCTVPMLPCIASPKDLEGNHSMREILCASKITPELLLGYSNTHKKLKHLAIIGLSKGENENSFPEINAELAYEFIEAARELATCLIIDCSSHLAYDVLSFAGILKADSVLRLMSCDLKAISYFSGQLPYLTAADFDTEKQYKVVSNLKESFSGGVAEELLGRAVFKIPYSKELENQCLEGNLFTELSLKESRDFRNEIQKIAKEVFSL